jgi:hypothetical protein
MFEVAFIWLYNVHEIQNIKNLIKGDLKCYVSERNYLITEKASHLSN